jgi:hypothetical protein
VHCVTIHDINSPGFSFGGEDSKFNQHRMAPRTPFLARTFIMAAGAASICGGAALPPEAAVLADINRATTSFRSSNTPGDCHWERATYFFGLSEAMRATGAADVTFARAWAAGNNYSCGSVATVLSRTTLAAAGAILR